MPLPPGLSTVAGKAAAAAGQLHGMNVLAAQREESCVQPGKHEHLPAVQLPSRPQSNEFLHVAAAADSQPSSSSSGSGSILTPALLLPSSLICLGRPCACRVSAAASGRLGAQI